MSHARPSIVDSSTHRHRLLRRSLVLGFVSLLFACGSAGAFCYLPDPLDLGARYVPEQPPIATGVTDSCLFDRFAWQTFIALQWPAVVPTESNGYKRGFPDPSSSFTSQDDPELPVWQTWKAKREIFRGANGTSGGAPAPWNAQIDYGDDLSGPDFPVCAGADTAAVRQALQDGLHAFSMTSKVNTEDLDESLEVVGEAFYPPIIRGQRAEPQVYKTSSAQSVLYEVKLNYDWFNYIVTEQGYTDATKRQADAVAGKISFPARTADYSPDQCSNDTETPCPTGAIETKSAWVLVDGEDTSKYHTTQALYYKDDPTTATGLCADLGTFLLVGFHVIQKTENQPFYIYATWGHVDNSKTNDEFSYQNVIGDQPVPPGGGYGIGYITSTTTDGSGAPHYGATRIPLGTRLLNMRVQEQIVQANPDSVWQNYQLVGTQFLPVDATATTGSYPIGDNDPGGLGQSFYLANLTLETNWGLQNFQGQPPNIGNPHFPISQKYRKYLEQRCIDAPIFQRDCVNTINELTSSAHNAGGCMGCHGVSQQLGYDFSFVLLRGGGGIETMPFREQAPLDGYFDSTVGLPTQATCQDCVLTDPQTFTCQCENDDQQFVEATLTYDEFATCAGYWINDNGRFACGPIDSPGARRTARAEAVEARDESAARLAAALADRVETDSVTDSSYFRFPLGVPQGDYLGSCFSCFFPKPGAYACVCPPYETVIDLSTCAPGSDGFYSLTAPGGVLSCD